MLEVACSLSLSLASWTSDEGSVEKLLSLLKSLLFLLPVPFILDSPIHAIKTFFDLFFYLVSTQVGHWQQ